VRDTPGPRTLAAPIQAALSSALTEYVFVAAGDLPFLDRGLVLHLVERALGRDAAVPFYRGFYESACAVYSKRMLSVISTYRENPVGPLSTCFSRPGVAAARVSEEEIRRFGDPAVLFLNVNTREDLERAWALHAARSPGKPE
jgi:molybdopterin-guanine dinucleotide biosynthesis protein A